MKYAGSLVIALAMHTIASAEPLPEDAERWAFIVPPQCEAFSQVRRGDTVDWNRWLSLAACIQDSTVMKVRAPDELAPMVRELSYGLGPAMFLYREAIAHGPRDIQIRAAFHAGSAALALITRARASLAADDPQRRSELRERLEPLLAESKHVAWVAFAAIDHEASEDPSLVSDDVTRNMVRTARDMLRVLPAPVDIIGPLVERNGAPAPVARGS